MRTVVLWDSAPGLATGVIFSLRKAKHPARTSENQTNVRSPGRQTIAITTPLNMALTSSLETLYAGPAYMKRRNVSPSSWLGAAGKSVPDLTSFADIRPNSLVLLQIHAKAKYDQHPTTSGRKSILLGGILETPKRSQYKCQKHRTTSLIGFKTSKNSIKSSWRFEYESAEPNAPQRRARQCRS
jgi:hypothetical protein